MSNESAVPHREAQEHFEKLLKWQGWTSGERNILRTLFQRWEERNRGGLTQFAIAELREAQPDGTLKPRAENRARAAMDALKGKLAEYYGQERLNDTVRFKIERTEGGAGEEGGYCLAVDSRTIAEPREDTVRLLFRNRTHPASPFKDILRGHSDILFVSAGAQAVFTDYVVPWFKAGHITAEHFRVLSWQPTDDGAIESYVKHFGFEMGSIKRVLEEAWKNWKMLENEFAAVEAYAYRSFPAALAIYNDEHMKVELLPFNPAGGERTSAAWPALVMKSEQASYSFFRGWFEDLWLAAMRAAPETEVHERWRAKRIQTLTAAGLAGA